MSKPWQVIWTFRLCYAGFRGRHVRVAQDDTLAWMSREQPAQSPTTPWAWWGYRCQVVDELRRSGNGEGCLHAATQVRQAVLVGKQIDNRVGAWFQTHQHYLSCPTRCE